MKIYRRKPSEIHAVQWTGDNLAEIEAMGAKCFIDRSNVLQLLSGPDGASGYVPIHLNDWAVRPVEMPEYHFWPVDNDHFVTSYETV